MHQNKNDFHTASGFFSWNESCTIPTYLPHHLWSTPHVPCWLFWSSCFASKRKIVNHSYEVLSFQYFFIRSLSNIFGHKSWTNTWKPVLKSISSSFLTKFEGSTWNPRVPVNSTWHFFELRSTYPPTKHHITLGHPQHCLPVAKEPHPRFLLCEGNPSPPNTSKTLRRFKVIFRVESVSPAGLQVGGPAYGNA